MRDRGLAARQMVELIQPDEDDYFVLKPKHSGFYSTTLEILLSYLGASTVVIVGLATNNCVFFTAADAFLRDLHIYVPEDCTAAIEARRRSAAGTVVLVGRSSRTVLIEIGLLKG